MVHDRLLPSGKQWQQTSGHIMATMRKTTPRKTTPRKTATRKPASAVGESTAGLVKEPTAIPKATTNVVGGTDPGVVQADLKKKELIDLVVGRSGIKKKDAKPVVEAMLAVLGETIAGGRELNLQPMGKLRINRTVDKGNGRVIVCKLRQSLRARGAAGVVAGAAPGAVDGAKDSVAETPDKL